MMFKLTIETGNAAFDDVVFEVARILRRLADKIEAGETEPPVMDYNGNRVGECKLTDQ